VFGGKAFQAPAGGEPLLGDTAGGAPAALPYARPFIISDDENRFGG
jgi:hypothetical protein